MVSFLSIASISCEGVLWFGWESNECEVASKQETIVNDGVVGGSVLNEWRVSRSVYNKKGAKSMKQADEADDDDDQKAINPNPVILPDNRVASE